MRKTLKYLLKTAPKTGGCLLAPGQALFERPGASALNGINSACTIVRITPFGRDGVTVLNFVFTRIVNHCVTVFGD